MNILYRGFIFLVFVFCLTLDGFSQKNEYASDLDSAMIINPIKPYFWSQSKEVGLDFTSLISRLVPFNFSEPELRNPLISLRTKWYKKTHAFRIDFGLSIQNNFDINNPNPDFFLLSLGREKRKMITKKISYTSGWEVYFSTFSVPTLSDDIQMGIAKSYGIEYHFNDKIFIATDTHLRISIVEDFKASLLPPTRIFLNVRL